MLLLSISTLSVTPSHASIKAGSKCAKLGTTSIFTGKTYTCVKKGKTLVWNGGVKVAKSVPTPKSTPVATPTATSSATPTPSATPSPTPTPTPKPSPTASAVLGSKDNPVAIGSSMKLGDVTYTITKVDFNVDSKICAADVLNDGCGVDASQKSIPDPTSKTTWVDVNFSAKNSASVAVNPVDSTVKFYLVIPDRPLLQNNDLVFGYTLLSDSQISPGGTGGGSVLFQVPKELTSLKTTLDLRTLDSYGDPVDAYFQVNW